MKHIFFCCALILLNLVFPSVVVLTVSREILHTRRIVHASSLLRIGLTRVATMRDLLYLTVVFESVLRTAVKTAQQILSSAHAEKNDVFM